MNKIKHLLLILSIAFLTMQHVYAVGEPKITVKVDDPSISAGQEVEASIVISNNPGIASLKLDIEATGVTLKTEEIEGYTCIQATNGTVFPSLVAGKWLFWSDVSNKTGNGELAKVTLVANENLADGEYSISVTVTEAYNEDGKQIQNTFVTEPFALNVQTAHNYGDWVTTKEATCTQEGEETRTCECGAKEVRQTEKLEHEYVDDICNVCGSDKASAPSNSSVVPFIGAAVGVVAVLIVLIKMKKHKNIG